MVDTFAKSTVGVGVNLPNPRGVCIAQNGNVYVTSIDTNTGNIYVIRIDHSNSTLIAKFGGTSKTNYLSRGIVMWNSELYVADTSNHIIVQLLPRVWSTKEHNSFSQQIKTSIKHLMILVLKNPQTNKSRYTSCLLNLLPKDILFLIFEYIAY